MKRDGKTSFRPAEPAFGWPRSAVGIDSGLATTGLAHLRVTGFIEPSEPKFDYRLVAGRLFRSERGDAATVAEANAERVLALSRWFDLELRRAVAAGAETFAAERYEQLRQASAAVMYAAGHAALVGATMRCDPRPKLQAAGNGAPAYFSARECKRAATGCDVASKRVVGRAVRRLVLGAEALLGGMRVADAEHVADGMAVALRALGHREKALLIGEVPEVAGNPLPFAGPSYKFLRDTAGGDVAMRAFALLNLVPFAALDREVSVRELEVAASVVEPSFNGRAVIFVGRRVADAFGVESYPEDPEWTEVRAGGVAYMAAVVPGEGDRFWRSPENAHRAKLFLRAAARVT